MKIQKFLLLAFASLGLAGSFTAAAQTRILPLGDSVTSSSAPQNSYRFWLWKMLTLNRYNPDFVGTQYGVNGGQPNRTDFDQGHEGHAGWTSADVLFNIDSIAAATVPDVVLLDIGGNDVAEGIPASVTFDNLVEIISRLRAVNPRVVVLLAQTTPYEGQNKRGMSLLRGAVKRAAKQQRRAGARVVIVNLAASYNVRRDTVDGIHPNERGERKIAKRYFSVLRRYVER